MLSKLYRKRAVLFILFLCIFMAIPSVIALAGTNEDSLDYLDGKKIGILTGSIFEPYVSERLPHAEISFYNTLPDMIAALESGKIDSFPMDESIIQVVMEENDNICYLDEYLDKVEVGMLFSKTDEGETLCEEVNVFLGSLRESGELDRLIEKWYDGSDEEKTLIDCETLPSEKKTLTLATDGTFYPFTYISDGKNLGYEIELVTRFCEENGYGLDIEVMNFDGILMAVQNGKVDFAASGFAITEERKESVLFSDPYYKSGSVMVVLKDEGAAGSEDNSFWEKVCSSFEKTFIREDRWKLFLEGIFNSLLITLLSILFGTILGFLIYILLRKGRRVTNRVTAICLRVIQGLPIVVLLMILYYIIFGSISISGIAVSVFGFTLVFGATVYGLLMIGVGAVDKGQYEAAYALGYSERHTFFNIILPQALPHVISAYKGEISGLIKATAVVGYIAVQDLTKIGDIIRSRTYEAFFPLISVAVIYFVMEDLSSLLVSHIELHMNSRDRRREEILKGVNLHDKD